MTSSVELRGFGNEMVGQVDLPYSKSMYNRAQVIRFLQKQIEPPAATAPEDVQHLYKILSSDQQLLDAGHAGTAFRFATAVKSITPGEWELTGSHRMKERPVKLLVDALKMLGADIRYLERDGFPPLLIKGKKLECTGTVEIPGNVSSQFVSALLMIGPYVKNGLKLRVSPPILSRPYIDMTVKLMREAGAEVSVRENQYEVGEKPYHNIDLKVEKDWSSASYFLAMLLAQERGRLFFPGLSKSSSQGDSKISDWFEKMGMRVTEEADGLHYQMDGLSLDTQSISLDFSTVPDMAQTFACLFLKKGIGARFSGCDNLNLKETNRLDKLRELAVKCGAKILPELNGELNFDPPEKLRELPPLPVYDDHRMAMSQAVFACNEGRVIIQNPGVVKKSFPDFWTQVEKLGFSVTMNQ